MPIIVMGRSKEEILKYHPDAVNFHDVSEQYRSSLGFYKYSEETAEEFEARKVRETASYTLFLADTWVGKCLVDRERNGYDDSDFLMLVWNDAKNAPEEHEFASTRGWSYPCYGSSVDATPEVLAKYEDYKAKIREESRLARIETERRTPAKGKTLKVIAGRKITQGTIGECFWYGEGKAFSHWQAKYGAPQYRVGIVLPNGTKVFTDAKNVEVVL